MHRFFVPPELLNAEEFELPPDVLHHLTTVLRRGAEEDILFLDGEGNLCRCRILSLSRRNATARVTARWREEETAFPVTLLQGLPKGEKMELVLQKGTELGVARFVPVLTGRTIPSASAERENSRMERWLRIVREAARQCRRPRLPVLEPPVKFSTSLLHRTEELRLFLWEEESRPLSSVLPAKRPRDAAVLVGPEGGFSSEEAEAARQAGFVPVRFGPRILRSETAGFAVASILQYSYGDLGAACVDTPQVTVAPQKETP